MVQHPVADGPDHCADHHADEWEYQVVSIHGVADAHDDCCKANDLHNDGANGFANAMADEITD